MAATANAGLTEVPMFGPYKLDRREIFLETKLSFSIVNMKPVVDGHVLILPKRVVARVAELSGEELTDLMETAQKVGVKVEKHFNATSLTFTIQDGAQAGQTVAHVHVHVLPRKAGDFEKNDEIYDAIDKSSADVAETKLDLDKDRKCRTVEEMAAEAKELHALFL